MAGFNNYKPKMPTNLGVNVPNIGQQASAATAEPVIEPRYTAQQPRTTAPRQAGQSQQAAPSYRPLNKEMQINIPDFLKNKR